MICPKCGNTVQDNCAFCSSCGFQCNTNAPTNTPKKKNVLKIVLVSGVVCLLGFSILVGSLVGFVKKKNDDMKKPWSEEETQIKVDYPSPEKYDSVLAYGDGYFLVNKSVETYNSAEIQFGVINDESEWVLELSADNLFAESARKLNRPAGGANSAQYMSYEYLGDGIFIATLGVYFSEPGVKGERSIGHHSGTDGNGCYFYNAKTNDSWEFNASIISKYEGDYMLACDRNNCLVADKIGNIKKLDIESPGPIDFAPLSDGVFLSNKVFYDINGNVVLSVEEYDLENEENTCFIDGECEIKFRNPAGTLYAAVIDKNGDFIKEPYEAEEEPTYRRII